MSPERYAYLDRNVDAHLTIEEILEGYHFCADVGFLLVGPGIETEVSVGHNVCLYCGLKRKEVLWPV